MGRTDIVFFSPDRNVSFFSLVFIIKEGNMKSFYGSFAVALVVSVVFFLLFDTGMMKLQGLSLIFHK